MSGQGKLSIIMAVWQRPQRTRRAIRSVLEQKDPNWELICVGDAEPDIDNLRAEFQDPRIIFHNLPQHDGAFGTAPRNWALERFTGSAVCFLDNDDILLHTHVNTRLHTMAEAQKIGAEVVVHFSIIRTPTHDFIRGGQIAHGVVGNSELCIAADRARKHRFNHRGYGHDWILIQEMHQAGARFSIAPTATYIVTHTPHLHEPGID